MRDRKISSCTWESDISRQTSHEDNTDDVSSSSSSDDEDDLISEDGKRLTIRKLMGGGWGAFVLY